MYGKHISTSAYPFKSVPVSNTDFAKLPKLTIASFVVDNTDDEVDYVVFVNNNIQEEEFEKYKHAIKDDVRLKRAKHAVYENQRTIKAVAALKEKFNDLIVKNGTVENVDDWGKRRLAYPIEDMNEGYYTVATFKSESDFPAELQRLMNIDESVLRVMVIKLEYEAVAKATEAPAAEAAEEAPANDAE